MISDNELLFNSLKLFYKDDYNLTKLLNYLKVDKISLRIIDWFVTNYSKKYDCMYTLYSRDGIKLNPFNVFYSYKSQLKSYSKKFFDPFCRRNRIKYKYNDTDTISTTVGQLNFFKWVLENNILTYLHKNFDTIEKDMNRRNSTSKRKEKSNKKTRKKREELSISASKSIKKEKVEIVVKFN